jgi:hypothetical protein
MPPGMPLTLAVKLTGPLIGAESGQLRMMLGQLMGGHGTTVTVVVLKAEQP